MRPTLHLTPSQGWLNDPLAVTHRDGRYHLFFQHVPGSTTWDARCQWGHATSVDLLRWEEQPVALSPAPDELGCWSGCLVPSAPVLFYTSVVAPDVERGRVRAAHPVDDSWTRWEPGDVVAELPQSVVGTAFRDPFVFSAGSGWQMLVGARLEGGTAAALRFSSDDLRTWSYQGPLLTRRSAERDQVWTGTLWECPQLLRLGGADVLVVSVCSEAGLHHVAAAVGSFDGTRFVPRHWQQLTEGVPYAATTFRDADGGTALITWLQDVAAPTDGWAGALSIPLTVSVVDDRVRLDVHPAVAAARQPGVAPGRAIDCEWRPAGDGRLVLQAGESAAAVLVRQGDTISVTAGDRSTTVPVDGPVRVLADGPVLEVLSGGMLAGLPLTVTQPVSPTASEGDSLDWWLLG